MGYESGNENSFEPIISRYPSSNVNTTPIEKKHNRAFILKLTAQKGKHFGATLQEILVI
jgi:hypothetical protein